MARILVYNNDTNRMETYIRGENESMPYNTNGTLRVREFRGSSRSNILWTTRNTMRAWNSKNEADALPRRLRIFSNVFFCRLYALLFYSSRTGSFSSMPVMTRRLPPVMRMASSTDIPSQAMR